MTCVGLANGGANRLGKSVSGSATTPSRIRGYQVKHIRYPVKLKGRAWIAVDTHQVVRLEADLAEEIPAIRLRVKTSGD
jgi:hypothetical protein